MIPGPEVSTRPFVAVVVAGERIGVQRNTANEGFAANIPVGRLSGLGTEFNGKATNEHA